MPPRTALEDSRVPSVAADSPSSYSPTMDPRIAKIFQRWGFLWGGTWLVPDGSHFEYHRAATG